MGKTLRSLEEAIKDYFKNYAPFNSKTVDLEKMRSASSRLTYKVNADSQCYFLSIDSGKSFAETEFQKLRALNPYNLAPFNLGAPEAVRRVYGILEEPFVITKPVPGKNIAKEDVEKNMPLILKKINSLSEIPVPQLMGGVKENIETFNEDGGTDIISKKNNCFDNNVHNQRDFSEGYIRDLRQNLTFFKSYLGNNSFAKLADKNLDAANKYVIQNPEIFKGSKVSLAHSNLDSANMLIDEADNVRFINWSDAQIADPAFEISRFLDLNELKGGKAEEAVRQYALTDKHFKERMDFYSRLSKLEKAVTLGVRYAKSGDKRHGEEFIGCAETLLEGKNLFNIDSILKKRFLKPEVTKQNRPSVSYDEEDDAPTTFKGIMKQLGYDVKQMVKYQVLAGVAVVGMVYGIGNLIQYNNKVFTQNLVPTLKSKILAEVVYANNPSKRNKEAYTQRKAQLDKLVSEKRKLSRGNLSYFLENQGYLYRAFNHVKIDGENIGCKQYLGKILAQIDVSEIDKPVAKIYDVKTQGEGINLMGEPFTLSFKDSNGMMFKIIEVDKLESIAKEVSKHLKDYIQNNEYFEKNDPRTNIQKQAIYKSAINDIINDVQDPEAVYSAVYKELYSSVARHENNHIINGIDKDSILDSEIKANLAEIRGSIMGFYTLEKWEKSKDPIYRMASTEVYKGLMSQANVKTKNDLLRLSSAELSRYSEQVFRKRYNQAIKFKNPNWKGYIRR